jgi:hypothetical protein
VTYSYSTYGLVLTSDVLLPGLPAFTGSGECPGVTLNFGPEPAWVSAARRLPAAMELSLRARHERDDPSLTLSRFGDADYFELAYAEGARFVIDRNATRIWGTWSAPLTIEDAITYLLGPVMGFVLRLRGTVALHASAVCLHRHAIVLCGESEAGKSTTVAAFALAGSPVLAEDLSPIHPYADGFRVQPGYPRVCLWPDSVAALLGSPDTLPALTPTWEKRFLPLDDHRATFESQPQPLGAIYILTPRTDDSRAPYLEPLTQREALLQLIQNTYMNWLLDRNRRAAELDTLTQVVAHVPVRRVTPHSDPIRLRDLCDLITRDAASLLPAGRTAAHSA